MAKKENETTEIVVRIYGLKRKYKEKPFLATPVFDQGTGRYLTGQEDKTEAFMAKEDLIISPEKNYAFQHGDRLVLQQKSDGSFVQSRDYTLYRLALVIPEIAKTLGEANKNVHCMYLENKEAEAVKTVEVGKLRSKAFEFMNKTVTLSDMRDILFYFGENATNFTNSRAEGYLLNKCVEQPQDIVRYFEDETRNRIVFVKKCLQYRFLNKSVNGYIMYGQITLGADEFESASFIYNDKNQTIYSQLYDQLKKKEGLK